MRCSNRHDESVGREGAHEEEKSKEVKQILQSGVGSFKERMAGRETSKGTKRGEKHYTDE